jgi:hypothetical protein
MRPIPSLIPGQSECTPADKSCNVSCQQSYFDTFHNISNCHHSKYWIDWTDQTAKFLFVLPFRTIRAIHRLSLMPVLRFWQLLVTVRIVVLCISRLLALVVASQRRGDISTEIDTALSFLVSSFSLDCLFLFERVQLMGSPYRTAQVYLRLRERPMLKRNGLGKHPTQLAYSGMCNTIY